MSRKSQRDESLEHLLRDSLGTSSRTRTPGSCPDAETLAAWADRSLGGRQLAAAQAHVSDCVTCQATLAVLARTTPADVGPGPWWRRGLNARWLVPMAATATALALWVVVPRDEFTRPPLQPQTDAREVTAPQTEPIAKPTAAPSEKSTAEGSGAVPRPLELPTAVRRDRAQEPAADAREDQQNAEPPALQRPTPEPKPDPPASPALESAQQRQEAAPAPVGRAAAAAPVPAVPVQAQAGRLGPLQESATVESKITITSPGTAFRWSIGPARSVEFSTDAGITWESRPTGADADLTAGASPGGTVCWVVGRDGTVLLTTDGRQWRRVASPAKADLNRVQATDARSATVTSVDGARFRTVDGGATWERL